jgi:hypothetical protein
MSIDIKRMPEDRAILIVMLPPPVIPKDTVDLQQAVSGFKKEIGGHVYRIVDLTKMPVKFSDLVMAMASDMNPDGGINDPDVSTIYIGSGELLSFGAKAFQEQKQYGPTNIKALVATLDEALAFARTDTANKKK